MYIALRVEYPLFLSRLMKHEFSRQISEKYPSIYVMKIRLMGAELFNADRQTDRQFSQFCGSD